MQKLPLEVSQRGFSMSSRRTHILLGQRLIFYSLALSIVDFDLVGGFYVLFQRSEMIQFDSIQLIQLPSWGGVSLIVLESTDVIFWNEVGTTNNAK